MNEINDYNDCIYKQSQKEIQEKSPTFVEWFKVNGRDYLDEVSGFFSLDDILEVAASDYAVQQAYYEYLLNKKQ